MTWRFIGCLIAVLVAGACNRSSAPEVVVYTSVDDVFARPIAERFEKETGIVVRLTTDTEETKSAGLLNRLIVEKERPQADVFWSGDPIRAAILKAKGVSAPYRPSYADGLPQHFSDPEGHWTGFSARARVLIYNRNFVPEDQEPQSVMDLLTPRFKDKACIANPLFGTTSMHAAALFAVLGEEKARAFFEEFAANGGKILSSNGEVRRRVAAGEFAVGIADTDDVNVARLEGKPVGVVYPDSDGMGTLIIPNCAVLIAGGPHAEAGRRFIDYLLRPEIEKSLAESEAAQMPLRPGVPTPPDMITIDKLKPMAVDYTRLAGLLEKLSRGYLKEWIDRNSR
ncbi:MAG: extracellular solute-binding protein [Deltaproteobacteria bacterium]|nr:extracellular solute-binding protein [Deltaproteobacteria bacterium]